MSVQLQYTFYCLKCYVSYPTISTMYTASYVQQYASVFEYSHMSCDAEWTQTWRFADLQIITQLMYCRCFNIYIIICVKGAVTAVSNQSSVKMAALAVVETPSGKDALAEGLLDLLRPAVQQLDLHVHSVRQYIL